MNSWRALGHGIHLYPDSCNVYAVRGRGDQWLIVNAGTGRAAWALGELGEIRGLTLLLTHHFRDHSAGAEGFRSAGAVVYAPSWERDHLAAPQPAFRLRERPLQYDLAWDHFAPVKPIAVDRWLMDYERAEIAGLALEVVPTPGASMGAVAYVIDLPDGPRVAFSGELMSGPGRVPRLSPFQYNYNDLLGAENLALSWDRLMAASPAIFYPSLGEPIDDAAAAREPLRKNLDRYQVLQPGRGRPSSPTPADSVEQVLPRLFRSRNAVAETHFIIGKSGRTLALDYGYDSGGIRFPQRTRLSNRRTLLHSIEGLKLHGGTGRVDTVIASHYHDDHVAAVALLQRLFQTELWAGENFADLIERPANYNRPCLWYDPIPVARRLPLGQRFGWEDVAVTLHPMVGHTEFSTLMLIEFDGHRLAHVGDQFFFQDAQGANVPPADASGVFTNHVYRNGIALEGYRECLRRLRAFNPHLVLSGHARPFRPDERAWSLLETAAREFDEAHRALMNLGDTDVHFGLEGTAAMLQPYCLLISGSAREHATRLEGWVLNPFNRPAVAHVPFETPVAGWRATPLEIRLGPREKRTFSTDLSVPPGACRRQPIALDLTVDERPFGQVAECWVTVDHDSF